MITGLSAVALSGNYNDLLNKPNLSNLHEHSNINTLNKISERNGHLDFNGHLIIPNNNLNRFNAKVNPNRNNDFIQGYTVGSRWINVSSGQEFVCVGNDIGNAKWLPTTNAEGGGGVPKLIEIEENVIVPANQTITVSFDTGFNKYDIRTVYGKSLENNDIAITIRDSLTNGYLVYQSLQQKEIYDIANVPSVDKTNSNKIHLEITNFGFTQTTVKVNIKVTNLI